MTDRHKYWGFDVSALMVLVGETEEFNYRLMERTLLECLSPCPVVGLQCYIRSFEWQLECSKLQYYSPLGCKFAPLRNMRLAQAIAKEDLLVDGNITICDIPQPCESVGWRRFHVLLLIWVSISWILFFCVLGLLVWVPDVTWIGKTNCLCLSIWSMLLRLLDHYFTTVRVSVFGVTKPDDLDAVFILGRRSSCFVLRGSRSDIKKWTACGLSFSQRCEGKEVNEATASVCKTISRVGSFLQLALTFTTIPNGTTQDQLMFVALNIFGQLNVIVGQKLNAKCLFNGFRVVEKSQVRSRTEVCAFLIRHFAEWNAPEHWIDAADLLPSTETWRRWKRRILSDTGSDPKNLYNIIVDEIHRENRPLPQDCSDSEYETAQEE